MIARHQPDNEVTVLGAGIVGVCCALSLQERGYSVTLIDQQSPGEAASFGNAGVISPWSCVPQCVPGVWSQVPGWLVDPHGPVRVHLRFLPRLLPWAARFLSNSTEINARRISDAMDMLMRDNVTSYRSFLQGTGHEDLIRDSWYVNVFRGSAKPNMQDFAWKLRVEHGAPIDIVGSDRLREIEPALSDEFHSAVIIKDQARAASPGRLCKVLADKACRQGATFLQRKVLRLTPTDSGGPTLHTDDQDISTTRLVLCGGIWSSDLLKPLGFELPLVAERGYHLEFPEPEIEVNNSILDVAGKCVVSSMEGGLRSAGTSEFTHVDAAPNYGRAEILKPLTKRLLPKLNTSESRRWMGIRPSFPDNLPAIGAIPGTKNLYGAFGHSHYGLGMAPATGRILTEAVDGNFANSDRQNISFKRFFN